MDVVALVLAFALVGLNAFFVATEFAIVKVRPTRIEELLRRQRRGSSAAQAAIRNLDAYLSATQLGITLASLGLGWIGEPAFHRLMVATMQRIGLFEPAWIEKASGPIIFVLITVLHIVCGELVPKSLALLRAESVALAVSVPMRVFYITFFVPIWLLNRIAGWVLRAAGVTAARAGDEVHSEEEIKMIVAQARSAGLLSAARSELLKKAMSLPTKTAKQLMVPRSEVVILDIHLNIEQNLARAEQSGHALFPLCDRELDQVIGIIDVREALFSTRRNGADLVTLAHPAVYLPELMSGERLLAELRDRHIPMAIVVDEYGGASGIVTPSDIISAVMGEFDEHPGDMVELPGGVFDIEGSTALEEVEAVLHIDLETQEMRTVSGFLIERLGRIPHEGDRVTAGPYTFRVTETAGPRVRRVRVRRG